MGPTDPGSRQPPERTLLHPAEQGCPASGLRFRLLLLVFLCLLPAFGIALYTGYQGHGVAQHNADHHATSLALQTAQQQAQLVNNARAVLNLLASLPVVAHAPNPCQASMLPYALALPSLAMIGVTDAHGRVLCSVSATDAGRAKRSKSTGFRKARLNEKLLTRSFQIGHFDNKPALVIGQTVKGTYGGAGRTLFAALRLGWSEYQASSTHLPADSVLTLFGDHGQVLARYSNTNRPEARALLAPAMLRQLVSRGHGGVERVKSHGHIWLVTNEPLGNRPTLRRLHVAVAIPTTEADAAASHALYTNLAILTFLGLGSLVLTWFVGDHLVVRPVRRLARAVNGVAAGDLKARTGIVTGPDEILRLGHAFDRMATSLEQRVRQSEQQKRRIDRLNRIYQVLSAINGAIIRIHDRDQLFKEVCRIANELGQFPSVWIGIIDPNGNSVRIVSQAGHTDDYTRTIRVTLNSNEPEGRGVVGQALRTGRHAFSNHAQHDPRLAARRALFAKLNIHSAAAFPLSVQQRVVGALTLHATEPGFFDAQELALLDELAADTSLGLEQIEKDRQLNYLAYWDPLTNLPNRTLLEDRLGQSLRRAERSRAHVVVLILDIIEFGRINDTIGRAAADQLLKTVATRLAAVVRDSDSLGDLGTAAARLAGHEFALVLDDVSDLALMNKIAERIRGPLSEPVTLGEDEVTITTRLGASIYPYDGTEPEELLQKAQFAAHVQPADQAGPLVFYSPEKDTEARARYDLERDLRRATEDQGFYLEYQPRVDAQTGQTIGAEALIRWERPGHGRVPPDQFIPVLEETGLIDQVGEWVARTAFAQRLAWHGVVPDNFVVAVNASSHELRTPDYVSRIRRLLDTVGVRPEWLEIEITESGLVETGNTTLEMLSALKAQGLRLSVDDFGTGYSSLSYLRQFPVDTLKIDRSFVRDITQHEEALSIVRSILALAKTLKLTVVAEGVETKGQLNLLRAEGCQEIQGYYFSRPLSVEALLERVKGESAPP